MPRRGIAVAVIVIVASFIVLGLTSDFLVDWAWFSAIGVNAGEKMHRRAGVKMHHGWML